MSVYQHILLATDLSETCLCVAERACQLAKEFHAHLTMIHVIEPIPSYGYGYMGLAELEEKLIETAREEMENLAIKFQIPKENLLIEMGSVRAEIARISEEKNVDLIVIGTHGRHGIKHLIGSTAASIMHGTKRDVLVVHII